MLKLAIVVACIWIPNHNRGCGGRDYMGTLDCSADQLDGGRKDAGAQDAGEPL